jgi:hypothetical protein
MPETASMESVKSPFKFLNYFTEEDAVGFAGREAEVRVVLGGISAGRTFVLYGPSGVGKSSLLHAEIIPRLRTRDYRPVYLRVLNEPVSEIVEAVNTQLEITARAETLPAELAKASAERPVVIILDQFEEFFTRFEEPEKKPLQRAFITMLRQVLEEPAAAVQIVFSLREDYYAGLADLKPELPDLFSQTFRLVHLTAFGARQAITTPLNNMGMTYDAELVKLMVDDLAKADFDPLILQILCTEIFNAAQKRDPGTHHLSVADFMDVGGCTEIFLRYVTAATNVPDNARRLIIYSILDTLTTDRGTKMAMRLDDLTPAEAVAETSIYFKATRDQVQEAMRHLEARSIVRPINVDTYELLHDRLVKVLRSAIGQDPIFNTFRNAKRFVTEFTRSVMDVDPYDSDGPFTAKTGQMMSVQQLEDIVQPFESVLRLTARETDFVLRSHIVGQTPAIPCWMETLDRFPDVHSERVIVRALQADEDHFREGAAFAVRYLVSPGPETLHALADVALTDPEATVRRRACESLALHADRIDAPRVRAALREKSQRRNALDLLTELAAIQKTLPRLNPLTDFLVARRLRKRTFYEARDAISTGAAVGAAAGAVGGTLWILTVGVIALAVFWGATSPMELTSPRGYAGEYFKASILLFLAPLLGMSIGWRAGIREQKRNALIARPDWVLQPVSGPVQFLFVVVVGFIVTITTGDSPGNIEFANWFELSALALFALGLALRRARHARTENLRSGRSALGQLVVASGPLCWFGSLAVAVYEMKLFPSFTRVMVSMLLLETAVTLMLAYFFIAWSKRCMDRHSGIAAAAVWSAIVGALAPFAIMTIVFLPGRLHADTFNFFTRSGLRILVGVLITVLSFVAFVGSVVCCCLHVRYVARSDAPRVAYRYRILAALTAAVAVIAMASMYRGSIPTFIPGEILVPGSRRIVKVAPDSIENVAQYYVLDPAGRGPIVITISSQRSFAVAGGISGKKTLVSFPGRSIRMGTLLPLSPGERVLGWKLPTQIPSYDIAVVNQRLVNAPALTTLGDPVYAEYRLQRTNAHSFDGMLRAKTLPETHGERTMVDIRIIAVGIGEEPQRWFTTTQDEDPDEGPVKYYKFNPASHERTDPDRWSPITRLDLFVRRIEFPHACEYAPESVPGGGDLGIPLSIRRIPREKGDPATAWWEPEPKSVTVIAEFEMRRQTSQEAFAEGRNLLDESDSAATPQERNGLRVRGLGRLSVALASSGGASTRAFALRLYQDGRYDEVIELIGELDRSKTGIDKELLDVYAHAAYGRHQWRLASEAWDRAEKAGFRFDSEICQQEDTHLRKLVSQH